MVMGFLRDFESVFSDSPSIMWTSYLLHLCVACFYHFLCPEHIQPFHCDHCAFKATEGTGSPVTLLPPQLYCRKDAFFFFLSLFTSWAWIKEEIAETWRSVNSHQGGAESACDSYPGFNHVWDKVGVFVDSYYVTEQIAALPTVLGRVGLVWTGEWIFTLASLVLIINRFEYHQVTRVRSKVKSCSAPGQTNRREEKVDLQNVWCVQYCDDDK